MKIAREPDIGRGGSLAPNDEARRLVSVLIRCPDSLQEAVLLVLDPHRGENARPVRPGINSDPVGAFLDLDCNRVPVDDEEAVVIVSLKKAFADPAQVRGLLCRQVDARAYAGMDQQIVAKSRRVGKRCEEGEVAVRDGVGQIVFDDLLGLAVQQDRINAIAARAIAAAGRQPALEQLRLAPEPADQHVLVIALQADQPGGKGQGLHQPFNDGARMRSAVDDVAKRHDDRLPRRPCGVVLFDFLQQQVQQVQSSMDIADGIATLAGSAAPDGWRSGGPGPAEEITNHSDAFFVASVAASEPTLQPTR